MNDETNKVPQVTVNIENKHLEFDNLGVTVRRLMGAASADYGKHRIRKWTLLYKGVPVGSIQLRSEGR